MIEINITQIKTGQQNKQKPLKNNILQLNPLKKTSICPIIKNICI